MRQRRRAGQRQARDDGEDRGEGHRGDESEERLAAHRLRQQRRRHVAARIDPANRRLAHEHHGAEAEDEREQVERADHRGGVGHRDARRVRIRHGIEAHQDVRQPRGAEHQRQPQRNAVDRSETKRPGASTPWPFCRGPLRRVPAD